MRFLLAMSAPSARRRTLPVGVRGGGAAMTANSA
jgi:hypothetical protein